MTTTTEKQSESQVFLDLTAKQQEFVNALLTGLYTRALLGGAVGGAKTIGILSTFYLFCKVFPGSRWCVVRKDGPTLRRTTIPSFWQTCPKPFFSPSRFNKTEMLATASNGSQILFMPESIREDPFLTRFDGLEVNGFGLEEAHELQEETYFKCIDRAGRWRIDPMPSPFILKTCNPHQGWLKKMYYEPSVSGTLKPPYIFIRALPIDNPHLSPEYIQALEELKKRAPHLYRKRVLGSWDAEDDVQQLISWEVLDGCRKDMKTGKKEELELSMGVDVGRYGKDPSVWYVVGKGKNGYQVLHRERYEKTSGPQVVQKTKEIINDFNIPHHRVFFDIVGLGGFAFDELLNDGYDIQSFVGGAKAESQDIDGSYIFENLNSQVEWNVKILAEEGQLHGIPEACREDLGAYGYDIKGEKKIVVWSKDVIKKKIKRSPDDGDAFKYAIWGQIYDDIEATPGFDLI